MISTENNTMINGNKRGTGRKNNSRNEALLAVQRLGEERVMTLWEKQYEFAMCGTPEQQIDAGQFLINKFLPNAKGVRLIKIETPHEEMNTLEKIQENEIYVFNSVCKGTITLEEGEKFFSLTEQIKKTLELTEVTKIVNEMQERLKEAGL